jgi:quercetin dioxygenase-like cupin family protein
MIYYNISSNDNKMITIQGVMILKGVFPSQITNLPQAKSDVKGVQIYIYQAKSHQVVFMEFNEDVSLPAHSHASQWGIILEGKTELEIDGIRTCYSKGDRYFVPEGVVHTGKAYAGAAVIEYFDAEDRYIKK